MNESNISKDHIALDVMKVLLEKSAKFKRSMLSGGVEPYLVNPNVIAKVAYDYADAMIAERERRNQQQED